MNLSRICLIFAVITLLAFNIEAKTKLFLIPHTHDDVGWLSTVDEYYYGKDTPFRECVKCILDSIFQILKEDSSRVFPYVEIAYFKKWYQNLTIDEKENVKNLVSKGSLVFINGGYVMNDEATTYYDDMIENLVVGHRFLNNEFGFKPTTGWHIDPFGHSSTQAYLFSLVGFQTFFIERIDYQEFEQKKINKDLDIIWQPEGFPEEEYILTHINYFKYGGTKETGYCMPGNICDMRDKQKSLTRFSEWVHFQKRFFKTDNVFFQVGNDFSFSYEGHDIYKSIEELRDNINGHPYYNITAIITSPDQYSKEYYQKYQEDPSIKLNIKKSDFFPYADIPGWTNEPGYWTGYYTSKSSLKYITRLSGIILQTARKIFFKEIVKSNFSSTTIEEFDKILLSYEEALSILQHHDANTGTAKRAVVHDYQNIMFGNLSNVLNKISDISERESKSLYDEESKFYYCFLNETSSKCQIVNDSISEDTSANLRVFNPGNEDVLPIKIKVPHDSIKIINEHNKELKSSIICTPDIYYETKQEDCTLYFADFFPGLEYRNYKLVFEKRAHANKTLHDQSTGFSAQLQIDESTKFDIIDEKNFKFEYCSSQNRCLSDSFALDYHYYLSYVGEGQKSGAYILRSSTNTRYILESPEQMEIYETDLLVEIKIYRKSMTEILVYSPKRGYSMEKAVNYSVVTSIRLFKNMFTKGIEIESHIFPLTFDRDNNVMGKEICLLIRSESIKNDGVFYTDSNGLAMIKRRYNARADYDVNLHGNFINGNFYPVTSSMYIEDNTGKRMSVNNDRSQGGTSMESGEIELMIHRRINADDQRGVSENLDERYEIPGNMTRKFKLQPIHVRTYHYLTFSNKDSEHESLSNRKIQYRMDNQPLIILSKSTRNLFNMKESPKFTLPAGLILPENIKFTIRCYDNKKGYLRIENLNDHQSIHLSTHFPTQDNKNKPSYVLSHFANNGINVVFDTSTQVSIATTRTKKDIQSTKYKFRELSGIKQEALHLDSPSIELKPMQIVVFEIDGLQTKTEESKRFYYREKKESQHSGEVTNKQNIDDVLEIIQQYKVEGLDSSIVLIIILTILLIFTCFGLAIVSIQLRKERKGNGSYKEKEYEMVTKKAPRV